MNSKIVNCYRLFTQQIVAVFEMYLYSNQPLIVRKVINHGVYSLWQDAYIIHQIYKNVYKDKIDLNYVLKLLNEKLKRSTIAIYSRLLKLLTKIGIFEILICIKNEKQYLQCGSSESSLKFYFRKDHFKEDSNKFRQSLSMVDRIQEDFFQDQQNGLNEIRQQRIIRLQKKTHKKRQIGWKQSEDRNLIWMDSEEIHLIFFRKGLRHTLLRCDQLKLQESKKWVIRKWKQYQNNNY